MGAKGCRQREPWDFVPTDESVKTATRMGEAAQGFRSLQLYRPEEPVAGDFRELFAEVDEWSGKAGAVNG